MTGFSFKRRLILGSGATALGALAVYRKTSRSEPKASELFRSIVDTIVPADEFAGALDLRLDQQLQDWFTNNQQWVERLTDLAFGIDELALERHSENFTALSLDLRENLLSDMLANTENRTARSRLFQLRSLIMRWYYQSEDGRDSLGYQLPADYPNY